MTEASNIWPPDVQFMPPDLFSLVTSAMTKPQQSISLSTDLTQVDAVSVNEDESKRIKSNDAPDLTQHDLLGVNAA